MATLPVIASMANPVSYSFEGDRGRRNRIGVRWGRPMGWPMWPAFVEDRAIEQLAVEDDAPADSGRHDDHAVVVVPLGRPHPALGERQRLAVEIAVHTIGGRFRSRYRKEWKLPPRRDRCGRHGFAVGGDRTGASDSDGGDAKIVAIGELHLLLDDRGEIVEVRFRPDVRLDGCQRAVDELALGRDQPGFELCSTADVDRQDGGRQLPRQLGACSVGSSRKSREVS